jgi:hypothetical protein
MLASSLETFPPNRRAMRHLERGRLAFEPSSGDGAVYEA